MRLLKNDQRGFTLVELLVVIGIIGLLATISVVALGTARQRSRDADRVSDIKQIRTALELHFNEQNGYPAGAAVVLGAAAQDCLNGASGWTTTGCANALMGDVPANPTPGGANYVYTQTGGGTGYTITFTLEGTVGELAAGAHTATQDAIN